MKRLKSKGKWKLAIIHLARVFDSLVVLATLCNYDPQLYPTLLFSEWARDD